MEPAHMVAPLDLHAHTDATRNSHPWTKERFYLVDRKPFIRWLIPLGRLRILWWGPRFFLSLSWRRGVTMAATYKFPAWQVYFGWGKCDGTRTRRLWAGQLGGSEPVRQPGSYYVCTWTFAEMMAIRRHSLDEKPAWDNMGGA